MFSYFSYSLTIYVRSAVEGLQVASQVMAVEVAFVVVVVAVVVMALLGGI
jgi:K+ transporter